MGAIAEGIVAFVQPLIDQTDGSHEQLNKALVIGHACYNLALMPADQRDKMIGQMQQSLRMDDQEFDAFRQSIVVPMIRRHEEMFPWMHGRGFTDLAPSSPAPQAHVKKARPGEKYPGTDRYAPCPCGSGEKYKFCCGATGR